MEVIGTVNLPEEHPTHRVSRRRRHARGAEAELPVQRESTLIVYINDIPTMQIVCSPNHLVELVCGRLFTERLTLGLDEIDALSICESSLRADVYLKDRDADLSRKAVLTVPTCCTNNRTLNDYFDTGEGLHSVHPASWVDEWIYRIAETFELDRTSHGITRGSHSAYLADETGVLNIHEDIGRHNAFDKAIGSALIDGIDLNRCLMFTSGRVPTDMMAKAVRAGLPLLVSKTVATDQAIDMAREFGLTLICNATSESFDVVCAPNDSPRHEGALDLQIEYPVRRS